MAYYKSAHSVVEGDVAIGEDVSIWHYAVVRADEDRITIGDRTNVQDGAVLHMDEGWPLAIGSGVTIGHRAVVHGCTIEDDVLVGMGAIVMNGAHVGAGSIIAAGAVITSGSEIPPDSLVMGRARQSARQCAPRAACRDSRQRCTLRGAGRKTPRPCGMNDRPETFPARNVPGFFAARAAFAAFGAARHTGRRNTL